MHCTFLHLELPYCVICHYLVTRDINDYQSTPLRMFRPTFTRMRQLLFSCALSYTYMIC